MGDLEGGGLVLVTNQAEPVDANRHGGVKAARGVEYGERCGCAGDVRAVRDLEATGLVADQAEPVDADCDRDIRAARGVEYGERCGCAGDVRAVRDLEVIAG